MFVYQVSEGTAAQRRVPLHLVDATDGITPETGEAAGQPQLSKNGAAFGNTSATLTAIGNGAYYVELTAAELDTVGIIVVRYKSAATAEAQVAGQVVSYDPYQDFTTNITTIDDFLDTEIAAILAAVDTEVGAIKTQTDKLTFTVANQIDANVLDWKSAVAPAMTGDAFARLGAPAGASVSADIAAVKVDTAAILVDTGTTLDGRLPAALTVDGLMKADTLRVGGTLQTAGDLAVLLNTIDDFLDTEIAAILAAVDTEVASILAAVDTEVASILAAVDTEVAAIKTVTDQLVAAHAEPTGVPAANATPLNKLGFVFAALRNKITVTSTKKQYFDDADAALWEKDLTDDGVTYTESEGNIP